MSIETIGLIASLTAILMFTSPIAQIRNIIKNRTSQTISPAIYAAMAINCTFWTIYGIGVEDLYITVPNSLGIVLGIVTLLIIYIYR
ncbi:MAG: hypothetical protein FJ150_00755 [Euryarchaeota archaeon]|nr:hypothetical protein [Euryarchaeota archaeon]